MSSNQLKTYKTISKQTFPIFLFLSCCVLQQSCKLFFRVKLGEKKCCPESHLYKIIRFGQDSCISIKAFCSSTVNFFLLSFLCVDIRNEILLQSTPANELPFRWYLRSIVVIRVWLYGQFIPREICYLEIFPILLIDQTQRGPVETKCFQVYPVIVTTK